MSTTMPKRNRKKVKCKIKKKEEENDEKGEKELNINAEFAKKAQNLITCKLFLRAVEVFFCS